MKNNKELKIYYTGGLDEDLDNKLRKFLKTLGYKSWASGMDLTTGTRDLAFDKENCEKSSD